MTMEAKIRPWLLWTLLGVVLIGGGFTYWYISGGKSGTTATTSPTATKSAVVSPTATPKPTPTQPPTTTQLTYTNSKYGFTLTLPASWNGYKFKEAKLDGSEMTYYMNVPTTDKNAIGNTTADAGYYSPFAISVYTPDQWAEIQKSGEPGNLLITQNSQYVFGWSHASGVQPDDWTKESDINTIIESFKLL